MTFNSFIPFFSHHEIRPAPAWCCDPVVGQFYALFGETTCLLPLGDNRWAGTIDLSQTRKPEFQHALANHNLAVVCGKPSGNLTAVIFASPERMREFVKLNPPLRFTLITSHKSVCVVWLRVPGPAKEAVKLPHCEWRSQGIFEILDRTASATSGFCTIHEPVVLELSTIKFLPEDWAALLDSWRTRQFGPQFVDGKPNLQHFASFLACELKLGWDPVARIFWSMTEPRCYGAPEIKGVIIEHLSGLAHRTSESRYLQLLSRSGLTKLMQAVQQHAICSRSFNASLQAFFVANYVPHQGGNVTNSEIALAFRDHYRSEHGYTLSVSSIRPLVRPMVFNVYGIRQSKSVKRQGKAQNGFRDLKVVAAPPAFFDYSAAFTAASE